MAESKNLVNFVVGKAKSYKNLPIKDPNTVYFLTDTRQIMKGESDYSSSVIFASVLPEKGIVGKLYIVKGKLSVCIDDSSYATIFDPDTKANLTGAIFTGPVKMTVEPLEDTDLVTKKYVDHKIASNDAMRYKGTVGVGGTVSTLPTSNVRRGDTYRVVSAGQYAGQQCKIGDMIIAIADADIDASDSVWSIIQGNIDGAVIGPESSTSGNLAIFDNATGKVIRDSDTKIGGEALEANPNDKTIATESAVKKYTDDTVSTVKTAAEQYTDTAVSNIKDEFESYADNAIKSAKEEMKEYADSIASGKMVWTEI